MRRRKRNITIIIILAVIAVAGYLMYIGGPGGVSKEPINTTMENGLQIQDTVVGEGDVAVAGNSVDVHYTGTLDDGTVFDSSYERETPITFTLGSGQVIVGWDQGIAGMRVGGKRTLVIPPELAYGEAGRPPVIPSNATLHFDVELMSVRHSQ